jgi:hypothetical protein
LNDVNRIISELEQQRAAIDRAIAALREIAAPESSIVDTQAPKKRRLSAAARKRIAEATRKRWALKRSVAKKSASNRPKATRKTAKEPRKVAIKKSHAKNVAHDQTS